jgi:hypothetical protein
VEQYRLERGGVVLGVVTRGDWDGNQGSWHDWGWLETAPGSDAAIELLTSECRLNDEAMRLEQAGDDPVVQLAEAARLQKDFMRPGVVLVSLEDGARFAVEEMHAAASHVYWR